MDRFVSMNAFVAAADTGSFSAAARDLGLSAAMVTKHVQSLEDRLGVRLLQRSTRRLVLTEAGAAYRDRCQQLLIEIEEAEATISADRLQPRGTLRVSAPAAFAVLQIARKRLLMATLPGECLSSWLGAWKTPSECSLQRLPQWQLLTQLLHPGLRLSRSADLPTAQTFVHAWLRNPWCLEFERWIWQSDTAFTSV